MSTYILLNKFIENKDLDYLAIPSTLYLNHQKIVPNYYQNNDLDEIINDNIYNNLFDNVCIKNNKKKLTRKNKKIKQSSKKNKK